MQQENAYLSIRSIYEIMLQIIEHLSLFQQAYLQKYLADTFLIACKTYGKERECKRVT